MGTGSFVADGNWLNGVDRPDVRAPTRINDNSDSDEFEIVELPDELSELLIAIDM